MNDLDWPTPEPSGGGLPDGMTSKRAPERSSSSIPPDDASGQRANDGGPEERNQRTQIVVLPSDAFALDAFASESAIPDEAPSPALDEAPPPVAQPAIAPAVDPVQDSPIQPIRDYRIQPIRNDPPPVTQDYSIEPILVQTRRGVLARPRTTLLQRCALFAALGIGVTGGGAAGGYFRRNPLDLGVTRIPANEVADQGTTADQAPATTPPAEHNEVGAGSAIVQAVATGGEPADKRRADWQPEASPLTAPTNLSATAARDRAETPAPTAGAATRNPLPPPAVVPPPQTPPARIEPPPPAGGDLANRDRSDTPSGTQAIPVTPRVPLEAAVVPPASAPPIVPDVGTSSAGTSSTADRVRVTDATPGIVGAADEQRIAEVLKRFTDAYTQLNAPAAKAVWPSVDDRALSRAFDALESQSIEFADCTVHFAGAEARAACVGNITYVPKIGRRSARTVNRQWNFLMRRSSDGWMIADAQMR